MEAVNGHRYEKMFTMKMNIYSFLVTLQEFVKDTDEIDGNFMHLLSDLTDCILTFVNVANVIKSNHNVEHEIGQYITCDNICSCNCCNTQIGKTYTSVMEHLNGSKHIKNCQMKSIMQKNSMKFFENEQLPKQFNSHSNDDISRYTNSRSPLSFNHIPPPVGFNNNTFFDEHFKGLFRTPENVIGFQQNLITPFQIPQQYSHSKEAHVDEQELTSRNIKKQSKTQSRSNENLFEKCTTDLKLKTFIKKSEKYVQDCLTDAQKLNDNRLYVGILQNLKDFCEEFHMKVDISCFGSRIVGLGTNNSDIDINITYNDAILMPSVFLQQLQCKLNGNSHWGHSSFIKSRVSLLRAQNITMGMTCDITFNNELTLANTKLMKYFFRIQPECHKIAMFLKIWTSRMKMYPQINTYTMNLLAFYYFQIKGYLPRVMDLIEPSNALYWPNKFTEKSLKGLNLKLAINFKELLIGFMRFYSKEVNFETCVLSIFLGSTIPKRPREGFIGSANFSHEYYPRFKELIIYMKENPATGETITNNYALAMCIQDPFSHDHNVSRSVGKATLNRFIMNCKEALKLLNS